MLATREGFFNIVPKDEGMFESSLPYKVLGPKERNYKPLRRQSLLLTLHSTEAAFDGLIPGKTLATGLRERAREREICTLQTQRELNGCSHYKNSRQQQNI